MSLLMRFHCDQENTYGTCARVSPFGKSEDEARRLAEQDGWNLAAARSLCPGCCGSLHRAPKPERPRRLR